MVSRATNGIRRRAQMRLVPPGGGETDLLPGPPNSSERVATAIDGGKMDGFVQAQADESVRRRPTGSWGITPPTTFRPTTRSHETSPLCHRWFAPHPGPTFPNRFYGAHGKAEHRSLGRLGVRNSSPLLPVFTDTVFDHLSDRGVSWRYFEHAYSFLRFFERHTFDAENLVSFDDPVHGFAALAKAGNLPSVSFVDPHYVDYPDSFCDEPPSDIRRSQKFIRDLVETVVSSPKWDSTLLIITYDEHGGFYDHVPPMPAVKVSNEMLETTGLRVPAFVISPWVKAGGVFGSDSLHFDHTSILKTIARRFMGKKPPYMGAMYEAANDLSEVLESQIRPNQFRPFIPYTCVCDASKLCLDVQSGSMAIGLPVQFSPNGSEAQSFRFEDAGDGFFYIPHLADCM